MTESRSASLASIIESVRTKEVGAAAMPAIRLHVLRNYTVEPMLPLLKFHCFQHGVAPVITMGDYDNIRQEILDTESSLYQNKPDLIVLTMYLEHLDPACASSQWDASRTRDHVIATFDDLRTRTNSPIVANTFLPPLHFEDGIRAGRDSTHRVAQIQQLNGAIYKYAAAHKDQIYVIDWQRILGRLGEDYSIDYRFYYMYRTPFKKEFYGLYSAEIANIARLVKGKVKKCLVLDCDNTLWGGVVGEEGLAGIQLDPHDYPGRCYYEFQRSILNLIDQGIIVTLCSKNNEADVLEVLDNHPHSLLKRSHLAAWRVNWTDKASNILALATELNLGLDSFVFVDDSGVECQLVKDALPEVTVIRAPEKVYNLPRLLYGERLFDSLSVSAEDRQRTAMYIADHQREELKTQLGSLDQYLRSLELEATIARATDQDFGRVAQLLGKTNQFNLTTRRHSEATVRSYATDPRSAVYVLKARDRFAELGLVGVLIATSQSSVGQIDSLLLSCRALGRRLEELFVNRCLSDLEAEWGITRWCAEYLPTAKNGQVRRFWEQMGFEIVESTESRVSYVAATAARARPLIDFVRLQGDT
jgi:FkbH-like protein